MYKWIKFYVAVSLFYGFFGSSKICAYDMSYVPTLELGAGVFRDNNQWVNESKSLVIWWQPPVGYSQGGSGYAYHLYKQFNGGAWQPILDRNGSSYFSSWDLQYTANNLQLGRYKFRVQGCFYINGSYSCEGSGKDSQEVIVRSPPSPPSKPASVNVIGYTKLLNNTFIFETEVAYISIGGAQASGVTNKFYARKEGDSAWALLSAANVRGFHLEKKQIAAEACNQYGCSEKAVLGASILFDFPEVQNANFQPHLSPINVLGNSSTGAQFCVANSLTGKCSYEYIELRAIYANYVANSSGINPLCLMSRDAVLECNATGSFNYRLVGLPIGVHTFEIRAPGATGQVLERIHYEVYLPNSGELTSDTCEIAVGAESCVANINWSAQGDYPVCIYKVNGNTQEELSCSLAVPSGQLPLNLTANPEEYRLVAKEPGGERALSMLKLSALVQGVSLTTSMPVCEISQPNTSCASNINWSISADYPNACVFKNGVLFSCDAASNRDLNVASGTYTYELRNSSLASSLLLAQVSVVAKYIPSGFIVPVTGKSDTCVPLNGGTSCTIDMDITHWNVNKGATLYKNDVSWADFGISSNGTPFTGQYSLTAEEGGTRWSLRTTEDGVVREFASLDLFSTTLATSGYELVAASNQCDFNPLETNDCEVNLNWRLPALGGCIFEKGTATAYYCPPNSPGSGDAHVKPGTTIYQLRESNSPTSALKAQVAVIAAEQIVSRISGNISKCTSSECKVNLTVFTNSPGNVCLYDNDVKVTAHCGLYRHSQILNYVLTPGDHKLQLVGVTDAANLTILDEINIEKYSSPVSQNMTLSIAYDFDQNQFDLSWTKVDSAYEYKLYKGDQLIYSGNLLKFSVPTENKGVDTLFRIAVCDPIDCVIGGTVVGNFPLNASSSSEGSSSSSAPTTGVSSSISSLPIAPSPYLTDGNINSPPPTELPGSPVGTIAGQFRVSESGAASYSVPLNLPAGVAGVTPQLSFDYASQSGNGLLGQGWSLSGLSAITRCRQTLIHDGKTNPITWSKEDRFCLDGQRLMLVSGAYYGQPNSEYRTEIDNYSLVTAVGGSDGHPDYFKVEAKDGSVSFYGFTADSKLTGGVQNTTLNWALNRFQDNVGNGIDFIYNNDAAAGQNIDEIRYGFPTPNSDTPSSTRTGFKSRIQFSYDERDDKSDAYVAGYKFSQIRKLASVSIYNTDNPDGTEPSELFRHYQLKYMSRTTTDARYKNTLTRLSHIYECVTPDIVGGSCLLPLSFSWGGGSHIAFDKNMTELSFPTAEPGRYVLNNLFADVTGDGKVDLIYLTYEKGIDETHADLSINIAYAEKDATGLAVQERINLYNKPYENIRIATLDYNADGRQDLAVYDEGHWKVHLAVVNADKQWRISKVDAVNLNSLTDKDTLFMDVNGDGLADAVTAQGYYLLKRNANAVHSNTAYSFSFQLAALTWSDTGFAEISAPSPTSISALTNCTQVGESKKLQQETAADFNGDGAVDFLGTYTRTLSCGASGGIQPSHVTLTYRYALVNHNGQLFNYGGAALQTPTTLGSNTDKLFTVDINSDGLSDIVQLGTDKTLSVRMNTGAGFNAVQEWTTLSGLPAGSIPQFLDYNGDGAADVIWRDTTKSQMLVHYWGTAATTTVTLFNTFSSEKDSYLVMDVSGDSVVDYLRISSESMSGRVGQMALKAEPVCETYPTGRGNEMRTHCNDPSYPIAEKQQHNFIYKIENGLGNITQITYGSLSNSGRYEFMDVAPKVSMEAETRPCPIANPGDCKAVYSYTKVDSSSFYSRLNGGWELPEGHRVWDASSGLLKLASDMSDKDNPVLEVNGAMQVVTMVKSSAPLPTNANAMSQVDYYYSEAKLQAMGRGFLGFNRLKTVDFQTGITTVTTYRQDFPFSGSPLTTVVYKEHDSDIHVLSYAINNWDAQVFGGEGTRRFQPYLKEATESSYVMDSAGSVSTDALQTVTTATVMYPNEHGNVHEVTAVTQGSDKTITQKTTNEYYSNDTWALRMGRLKRSSVNTTNLQGDSVTRIAEFKYYGEGMSGGAKGLLKEEKVITSEASDQLVTEYIYDQWGNKQTVSVTAEVVDGGIQTRSTTSTYDLSGRNLISTKNHSNQESLFGQYNIYGQPQTATDKNKLSTEIKYDTFGNEYLRVEKLSADETGAWTRKDSAYCTPSDCPANAAFYTRSRVSGGGEAVEYFDILGRVIRAGKISFDGRWVYTDTEYDKLNRVKRQSLPYYSGSTAQDWAENHYDDLGRITQVDSPHEQGTISSKTEYAASPNGLVTTLINPKGQKRKEVRNGLGQLIYVEDELGGSISYEYSLLGGLLSVTTSATDSADVVVKMCYDDLGRKTGMFDPDKGGFSGENETCETVNNWTGNTSGAVDGWWHYRYNAFGELLEQRDPKGQRTLMQYDELGRMINRKDYESGSHLEAHTAWFYDKPFGESEPTDKTRGKLTAVVMSNNTSVIENSDRACDKIHNNHCVIYRYNDRALVDMTWTLLSDGQDYFTETKFDDIGRAYEQRDVINGPIFMDSGVQTHFNEYGYAYRTVDIAPWDGTDGVLSTIKEVNVNGQVTKELRGNGLETVNTYYPQSGLLQSQVARDALGTRELQSNHYTWDELGNLTSRVNRGAHVFKEGQPLQQNNRKESFCYDALNRLVKTLPTDNPVCSGTSSPTDDIAYDGLGNITRKNGVGDYSYNRINGGPHAVTKAGNATYSYDNNGNMVAELNSASDLGNRAFKYTSYDMVKEITRDNAGIVEFEYGPDRARWQRIDNDLTTTTYLGNVERIETANTHELEWKRTVAGVVHTYKTTDDSDTQNLQVLKVSKAYLYKDHLGSVDIITDQLGTPTHSMSFDPWGARRKGDSNDVLAWVKNAEETEHQFLASMLGTLDLTGFSNPITTRGYTGHEMVDEMDIIHMNGRIYDAKLARFLQADPHIDGAGNTQGYNRYSYVHNNPLNATDPSGFFSLKNEFKKFAHAVPVHKFWNKYCPNCIPVIQIALNFIPGAGPYVSAAFGANNAYYLSGGSETAGIKSFGTSMAAYGAFSAVGKAFGAEAGSGAWNTNGGAAHIFAHAMVGGVLSELQGGKFGHGFAAAGIAKGIDGKINLGSSPGAIAAETAIIATIGGTVSEMTGGKFANGAMTAAFAHIFNEMKHAAQQKARMEAHYAKHPVPGAWDVISEELPGWLDEVAGEAAFCTWEGFSCSASLSTKVPGLSLFDNRFNGVKIDGVYDASGFKLEFALGIVSGRSYSLTWDAPVTFSHTNDNSWFSGIFLKTSRSQQVWGMFGVKSGVSADLNSFNGKIGAGFVKGGSTVTPAVGYSYSF